MAAVTADLHGPAAARVMAERGTCAECGAQLHRAVTSGDEWGWADEAGSPSGPAADLAHLFDPAANWLGASNPYQYLTKLGDMQGVAHGDCAGRFKGGPRADLTGLFWAVAREYTALMVRLDTGGYSHWHEPAREPWNCDARKLAMSYVHPRPDVIYHCDRPAWLRPSGWHCRECGLLLTDETASFTHPGPRSQQVRAMVAAILLAEAERS